MSTTTTTPVAASTEPHPRPAITNMSITIPPIVNDLDNLQAQLDLYENSFNQLKKDLPIYLTKYTETNKSCKSLVKSLRGIASSETNTSLQNSLFTMAQAYDSIDNEMSKFANSNTDLAVLIDDMKKLVFSPYREILNDVVQSRKSITEKSLIEHVEGHLAINEKFFEQYRVKYLINILTKHLQSELRFHCKAVEEITNTLSSLNNMS